MTGKMYKSLDMQGNKILGSADPSASTDLVTLQYLQNFLNGIDWKNSVRAASTGNLTLTGPGASIDGVSMSAGDRFLAKDQTTGSENGIYIWNGAASAATRAPDADTSAEVTGGMAVFVSEGTANADKAWVLTTNDPITLGTTSLAFSQFGGGTLPTAGNGLTLTGSTLDVGAGNGITVAADTVAVDPAVVGRKFTNSNGTHSAGTTVSFAHGLGHQIYSTTVKIKATGEDITAGVDIIADATNVTVTFSSSQGANTILLIVIG